jgi:hypothetical protein
VDSNIKKVKHKTLEQERSELDLGHGYAMKAPMTREKYNIRLGKFLDFIGLEVENGNRSLEDKARIFAKKSKYDSNWAFADILKFIQFQKDRVDKKLCEEYQIILRNGRHSDPVEENNMRTSEKQEIC